MPEHRLAAAAAERYILRKGPSGYVAKPVDFCGGKGAVCKHNSVAIRLHVRGDPGNCGMAVSILDHLHSGSLEFLDAGADLIRHPQALAAYAEGGVFHAAARHEFTALHPHFLQQCFRPDEIETVAEGDIRLGPAELGGDVGVLPVIVEEICHVAALLHHGAAAGDVVCPGGCLLCPGLVAVEPLAVDIHSHAGNDIIQRLMGAFMDDETVHPGEEFQVCGGFEVLGAVGICLSVHSGSGQGFGRNQILPVDVGGGG